MGMAARKFKRVTTDEIVDNAWEYRGYILRNFDFYPCGQWGKWTTHTGRPKASGISMLKGGTRKELAQEIDRHIISGHIEKRD
jgi:hypothetical protein